MAGKLHRGLLIGLVMGIGLSGVVDDTLRYLFSFISDDVRESLEAEERTLSLEIEDPSDKLVQEAEFGYLLVRYGNNEQFERESITETGRMNIQNREKPVQQTYDGEKLELSISVHVHQRLGTEFKLYADVSGPKEISEIHQELEKCDWTLDVDPSDASDQRLFILLDGIPETQSPEGYRNNFLPSNP